MAAGACSRPTADPLQLCPREQTFLVRDFGLSFDLVSCNHRIQWLMMVLISPRNPEVKRSILKRAVSSIYPILVSLKQGKLPKLYQKYYDSLQNPLVVSDFVVSYHSFSG